jgi:hypothetical protein
MKRGNLITVVLLISSTILFFVYVVIKSLHSPKVKIELGDNNTLARHHRYVTYSIGNWGEESMSTTNGLWTSFVENNNHFVYQKGNIFNYSGQDSDVKLSITQASALKEKIKDFFKTYIDGSYEKFLQFHNCSPYTVDVDSFESDKTFLQWLASSKEKFETPDQKLKTVWDFTTYLNAQHLWFYSKVKIDQTNGIEVSENPRSLYYQNLFKQYSNAIVSGEANEFEEYKILAISTKDYYVYLLKSTNADLPLINFQNNLMQGMQGVGAKIFRYNSSPSEIIAKQGYCNYAVVTASVKVNSCDCYVPITASFYWSPDDNVWIPFKMARFSFGGYFVLF